MIKLLLILLTSTGFVPSQTDLEPPPELPTQQRFGLDLWPQVVAESPEEQRMLWAAQSVWIYFGKRTAGMPKPAALIGLWFFQGWPEGWYMLTPPQPLASDFSLSPTYHARQGFGLTGSFQSSPSIVVVLNRGDFADTEQLYTAAEAKIEELNRENIGQIAVLIRGPRGSLSIRQPHQDSPLRDPQMIYWIADAELHVLFDRDRINNVGLFSSKLSIDQSPLVSLRESMPSQWLESISLK